MIILSCTVGGKFICAKVIRITNVDSNFFVSILILLNGSLSITCNYDIQYFESNIKYLGSYFDFSDLFKQIHNLLKRIGI